MARRDQIDTPAAGGGGAVADARPAGEASAARTQTAGRSAEADRPAGKPVRRALLRLALVALAGAAIWFGAGKAADWWGHGRFLVETDDAYVASDITTLSAKVAGYVAQVEAGTNQVVAAGDVVARLDDGDFRLAVQAAEDRIATSDAAAERIARQIDAAAADVARTEAAVAAARADDEAASAAFARVESLQRTSVASRADLDAARATRDKAAAGVRAAEAGVVAARAAVDVLRAEAGETARERAELVTARDKAVRDLSFTVIRAPVAGVVGNRAVETGAYVAPGQRLAAIVPLDSVHIDANFKETQLGEIRPGQRAEVTVDAIGGETVIEGTVESIAPATGSVFSLLPPENATGNFTKVVQRVPVRISLPADAATAAVLRPGLSAVVGIDTRTGG